MAENFDAKFTNSTLRNISNMASVDEQLLHESLPKIAEVRSGSNDDIAQ